jgi:conjugal transfer pilus assembly protein TraE
MDANTLLIRNTELLKHRKLLAMHGVLLMVVNLLLATSIYFNNTKTILVPLSLNKQVSVGIKDVSNEYIELIARDLTQSILNITPDNYLYIKESVLKLAHPRFYGELQQQLDDLVQDVKTRQIGIHFSPIEMNINKDELTAQVNGYLETKIGLKQISKEIKKYHLAFDYTGSQFTLKEFYEVLDANS